MVDRRPTLVLDAIGAIRAATVFCASASLARYQQDLMLRSAVERQLEILGEACTRLAREHPALFDELPSARSAVALRNRIAHGYDHIDDQTVFETVTRNLPAFEGELQRWLRVLDPDAPEFRC
jgi:uncharacterized protein with HEPN domain